MAPIINRDDAPSHLFSIRELDFSDDLFSERVGGTWFRLGAWTITPRGGENVVESVVSRQSILLEPGRFAEIFDKLDSVGNVIHNLGKPGGSVLTASEQRQYRYAPFHQFEFPFSSTVGEPMVFIHSTTSGVQLFINPDLWLFFELEERTPGSGIWWDPRRGVDALVRRVIDEDNLEVVEIRVAHLLKYLQARQMSLVIGHYHHLHLFDPSEATITAFIKEDVTLGSPEQGVKAIMQNWGLRRDIPDTKPFLQRRLHLWFEIRSPEIDADEPWTDQPSFDPYTFTLVTRRGLVAPARWANLRQTKGRSFEGVLCDFMDFVYFRQEVLMKYEGSSGFEVDDNGSVSHHPYWSLVRSTMRIGNELVATAIGDFAEGMPFEEWLHWKQYAVEPPSPETARALGQEQSVPGAVNSLVKELRILNDSFGAMGISLGMANLGLLWDGSLDSLAGRQLKWVYPATANDDELLKRATLISTLVIEELKPPSLRRLLCEIGGDLHLSNDNPQQSLGSRNLLQRLTIVATLIGDLHPDLAEVPALVKQAEARKDKKDQPDLQDELDLICGRVRRELAPLLFLYELRTYGGLAHAPNKERSSAAAVRLGLPEKSWHRTDYIRLLNLVAESIHQISSHLQVAAQIAQSSKFSESE